MWWEATSDIPYGFCRCGCGARTNIARNSESRTLIFRGEPYRFVPRHDKRIPGIKAEHRKSWEESTNVPYGYCWCGCGEKTTIATGTNRKAGFVRGCPARYVNRGHAMRKPLESWQVEDCGYETPCHVWTRATNAGGYGLLHDGTKMRIAHRFFHERKHGPLPSSVHLHHLCNNPPCVNIEHLQPVDQVTHGQLARNLKLDAAKAEEVRRLYANGVSLGEIATRYGISHSNAWMVASGKTWK